MNPRQSLRQPSKSRDTAAMLLGFVVVLALGDWVIARIDFPRVMNGTNSCHWKWELYEQAPSAPDVAFLGSCYGLFGVHSQVLAQTARESGREVSVMNLCTSSASMYTQYLYVRRMVEQPKKPKLVYLEVGPWGTLAVDGNALAHGIRALGDVTDVPMAASVSGTLLAESLKASVFSSNLHWADSQHLAKQLAMGAPLGSVTSIIYDKYGWGQCATPIFRPTGAPDADEIAGSSYSKNDGSVEARNPNARALRRTVKMLQEAGVAVRFLEMPRRSDAPLRFDPVHHADYQAFIDTMSAELGVPVVRMPAGVVTDDDYFSRLHLTEHGATKFSRWLAQDVHGSLESATSHSG